MISRANTAKIHIARQQLNLDDTAYRALLARVAGVRSSTELGPRQVGAVLREFERLGFKPRLSSKAKGKPHNFKKLDTEITKIEALLADMKLPWTYADAIAKRMFGIERCAWLKKPHHYKALIAALHVEQQKQHLKAELDGLLDELGYQGAERTAVLEDMPHGWERKVPMLEAVITALRKERREKESWADIDKDVGDL
ncbi:gp16 family protein [Halopseudomonas aestusnigri]|uniref:Mu-like prophage protein gp16 n=1 Tax=Halopseudomonas aestusnigri TaxID=857252 RepID=A0AAQ1GA77_9GAMM|nr:regulatory protein GemA [Halopseudomonas aestusnigri]OWL84606.1 hypothetical protein B7O88_16295 [Halopseudomonas aestusnigri]SEG69845.1 Mu-like prophage protein gp16 [Halopseudomonas aestusnigri]